MPQDRPNDSHIWRKKIDEENERKRPNGGQIPLRLPLDRPENWERHPERERGPKREDKDTPDRGWAEIDYRLNSQDEGMSR